jgi:MYXO-CTERM domain-containing protein
MRYQMMSAAILAVCAVGCGGPGSAALGELDPAPLTTRDDVAPWMTGSAPWIYGEALVLASNLRDDDDARSCPRKEVDGNTTRWIGNECVNEDGVKFFGTLTDTRDAAGSSTGTVTYQQFGAEDVVDCDGTSVLSRQIFDGAVRRSGTNQEQRFDIDLSVETKEPNEDTCIVSTSVVAWDYEGVVTGSMNPVEGRSVWNGKGRVGSTARGMVAVETVEEVIDRDECEFEPLSGSTTITSGEHEAIITYNGGASCSFTASAPWSLDGIQQDDLNGVACSVGPTGLSALGLLALGGLLRRRRQH